MVELKNLYVVWRILFSFYMVIYYPVEVVGSQQLKPNPHPFMLWTHPCNLSSASVKLEIRVRLVEAPTFARYP